MYPDRLAAGHRRSYARDTAGQQGIQIPRRTAAMQAAEENSIALDRLRVSQSRAIDPSWARSSLATSRFCRFMASAAVSGFTLALSANTAAAVGHRSCRGTSESAEHSGDAIFPFRCGKGELRRSSDPPLSVSSWYL